MPNIQIILTVTRYIGDEKGFRKPFVTIMDGVFVYLYMYITIIDVLL
jgi:hypothetical protein